MQLGHLLVMAFLSGILVLCEVTHILAFVQLTCSAHEVLFIVVVQVAAADGIEHDNYIGCGLCSTAAAVASIGFVVIAVAASSHHETAKQYGGHCQKKIFPFH